MEVDVALKLPVEQQMHLHMLLVENQRARIHTVKENILIPFHIFLSTKCHIIYYRLNLAREL